MPGSLIPPPFKVASSVLTTERSLCYCYSDPLTWLSCQRRYGVRTIPGSVCFCQDGRGAGRGFGLESQALSRRALILRVPSSCLSHGNSQDKSKGGSDLRFDLEQERFDSRVPRRCYESQLGGLHLSKHPPSPPTGGQSQKQ